MMAWCGVAGMLEVILSDIQRLQTEIEEAEAHARKKYDQSMDNSAAGAALHGKPNEKSSQDGMISSWTTQLSPTPQ